MSTALFDAGEVTAAGPAFDAEAAANFYVPFGNKAAARGMGEVATRFALMAEIDALTVAEAERNNVVPTFLEPDAYPIVGETLPALWPISLIRRLITNRSKQELVFGPVVHEIGSAGDEAALDTVKEFERLALHPEYLPMGPAMEHNGTRLWRMPTVLLKRGIRVEKEIVEADSMRTISLTACRIASEAPKPASK